MVIEMSQFFSSGVGTEPAAAPVGKRIHRRKQLCRKAGLLSPVYAFTDRGGCWFCPNARRKELRHLYDHHPDLWARMLELQALPGKVSEKFNRTESFSDIDERFRMEDAQKSPCEKAA